MADRTDKPLVVLLHGVGLDRTMWRPVSALLQDEFEVLALDLVGHGANRAAPAGTTLRDLAEDVAAALPAGGAHVVGFSLGALVAQHLARHRPDLVATLTSVSSVCLRTESERTAVLGRLVAAEADFPGSVEASLERWYAGTDTDPALVEETRATLLGNDVASYLNCYRVFATADAEIGPELPRITTPALAITGELDPGSTPEMTRRLAAALPDCDAVVVPGARHMLPVQQPHGLVTPLITFIRATFIRKRDDVASRTV
jgi:pimeloyl-ACP methyl ester carboxylesterase